MPHLTVFWFSFLRSQKGEFRTPVAASLRDAWQGRILTTILLPHKFCEKNPINKLYQNKKKKKEGTFIPFEQGPTLSAKQQLKLLAQIK